MIAVAYFVIVAVVLIVVLVWAVRSGQFRQQCRARHLPLEDDAAPSSRPSRGQARRNAPCFRPSPLLAAILLSAAVALGAFLFWVN